LLKRNKVGKLGLLRLPIYLYNGEPAENAKQNIAELLPPISGLGV